MMISDTCQIVIQTVHYGGEKFWPNSYGPGEIGWMLMGALIVFFGQRLWRECKETFHDH